MLEKTLLPEDIAKPCEAPWLEVRQVTVAFGQNRALDAVSCAFRPGRWTRIIGPNGAGKSTLIRAMVGLVPVREGQIEIMGRPAAEYDVMARARLIAYVPQRLEALPEVTALTLVAQGLYAWSDRLSPNEVQARAWQAMQTLGIDHLAHCRLPTLSGGQQQLCLLAGALAQNAKIILLDEPTTSLDLHYVERLYAALRSLAAQGLAIVSITHALDDANRDGANATLLLAKGQVLWDAEGFPDATTLAGAYDMPESRFQRFFQHCEAELVPAGPDVDIQTDEVDGHRVLKFSRHCRRKTVTENDNLGQERCTSPLHPQAMPKGIAGGVGELVPPQKISCGDEIAAARLRRTRFGLALLLLIALILCPFLGHGGFLNPQADDTASSIFWSLRLPRVVWAAAAGAILASVGASLQALLQNPLATPFTLGLASGASLGAMAAIQFGLTGLVMLSGMAFTGAFVTMAAVMAVAARLGFRNPLYCLLAGVAASMFCASLGLILQALATPLTAQQMMRWQLGGLEVVGYRTFWIFPCLAVAWGVLFSKAEALNLISVDASLAQARGVRVEQTRSITLVAASLATALVVAICGPIGFVGLLVPHWLRQRLGADLRHLLPLCAMGGALFLVLGDTISRFLEGIAYLPVGVIIALIGAPAFVWSMTRRR